MLAGGWLYCSGQIPLDPQTGAMVGGGDVASETRQVLRNLTAVLEGRWRDGTARGADDGFLADLADFQTVNGSRRSSGGTAGPSLGVAALPKGHGSRSTAWPGLVMI